MKTPIIIVGDADVQVFPTLELAESAIEPPDVKTGDFAAYDSEGRLLELTVVENARRGIFRVDLVRIVERPDSEFRVEELRAALVAFLHAVGKGDTATSSASLNELVNRTIELDMRPRPGCLGQLFGRR